MKAFSIFITLFCLGLTGCQKSKERMFVEETRGKSTKDVTPKMFATSAERFYDTKPSPIPGNP
ncbi:MAG: hypothetical protein ACK57I_07095, partial [Akkermansiaceae bacterium]